jgi:hypothetical protein
MNVVNPNSIRQIIRTGLIAGKTTKEIGAQLVEKHPTSMAAAKIVKHVAWYRAQMKKAGELPTPTTEVTTA